MITVDTFIDDGKYQDGSGTGDFPLAYIATDNVLGGFLGGMALAQLDRRARQGLCQQRQARASAPPTSARRASSSPCAPTPNITVLDTQFNDDDANKAAAQVQAVFARNADLAGVFGANLFSAIGAADGVKALGKSGRDPGRRLRHARPGSSTT